MNVETLNHRYKLIESKLRTIENSGNGATIHNTRHHISAINIYHILMNKNIHNNIDCMNFQNKLEKKLILAEKYLKSLVENR